MERWSWTDGRRSVVGQSVRHAASGGLVLLAHSTAHDFDARDAIWYYRFVANL